MKAEELRKSILQYAIQGKLVPQIDIEEPASILLERIRKEKSELVKVGKIKKDKTLQHILDDEKPFDLPDSWEWVKHNEIFDISGGSQPPKSHFIHTYKNGYIRLYQIRDYGNNPQPIFIKLEDASKITLKGDILLARYGASVGKVFKAEYGAYNVAMAKVIKLYSSSLIDNKYLYYFYKSSLYQDLVLNNSRSAQAGFNKDDLETLYFPLPPIQEQQRIVDRVEELMELVDEYEKKQNELEKLETEFPEKLKKSILQYAIQGKLVPQIDTEEPASKLIEKIKKEKAELIKRGEIKKEKPLSPITDDEKPFDIPNSWRWCRLQDIFIINPRNQINDDFDVSFIPMALLEQGFNNTFTGERKRWYQLKSNFTHLKNQDVAFAKIVPCFQNRKSAIMQSLINEYGAGTTELHVLRKYFDEIDCNYVLWFVKSPLFIDDCEANMTGTAGQQRVPTDYVKKFPFPLPPFSEQQRIIARIEELFKLVDLISSDKKVKLLDKAKDIADLNVISKNTTVQPKFDMESVGLAARAVEDVDNDTANEVKRQVQEYYDKKN